MERTREGGDERMVRKRREVGPTRRGWRERRRRAVVEEGGLKIEEAIIG